MVCDGPLPPFIWLIAVRNKRPHEFAEHLRGGSVLFSARGDELLAEFTLDPNPKAGVFP